MKQELFAYLIRDNEHVWEMPTYELLVALEQLMQGGITQRQSMSFDKAAIYEFLQTVKWTMHSSRPPDEAYSNTL